MAPDRKTWTITRHALDRFVERFDPESTDDEAMAKLRALLEDAVEVPDRLVIVEDEDEADGGVHYVPSEECAAALSGM